MVWTESYSHDEPVEKKTVSAVVEALQRGVNTGLEQLDRQPRAVFRDALRALT